MSSRVPARLPSFTVSGTKIGPSVPADRLSELFGSSRLDSQDSARCITPTRFRPVGSLKLSAAAFRRCQKLHEYQTLELKQVCAAAITRRSSTESRNSKVASAIVVGIQPSNPCFPKFTLHHHGRFRYPQRSSFWKYFRMGLPRHVLSPVNSAIWFQSLLWGAIKICA